MGDTKKSLLEPAILENVDLSLFLLQNFNILYDREGKLASVFFTHNHWRIVAIAMYDWLCDL